MNRSLLLVATATLVASGGAFAAEYGSAAEAKAMLDKAVAAVKADKAKALAAFNKGEGGSRIATCTRSVQEQPTATSPRIRRWSARA